GSGPRTLGNSEVRPYSWPCILVFVNKWVPVRDFVKKKGHRGPSDFVPERLYLPDGTLVPVCVIEAPEERLPLTQNREVPVFPRQFLGGGYPLLRESQGAQQFATVGCLVTDGHTCYALTSRHVTGDPGEPVYTSVGSESKLVGTSSDKQITRRLFEVVY